MSSLDPAPTRTASEAVANSAHAVTHHGTVELGSLLHEYQLGLVVIAGSVEGAGSRPVQWVHASELEDPTPFLTPRTVILTTGARLVAEESQSEADAYVERLIAAGTTALGIAVGLHWDRVPTRYVDACDRLGLPLFRVPYDTPFIAIVQTAARLIDAQVHARDTWLLESQRAVTNASLHRDGLGSAVRESASRLNRWVAITDRSGRIIEFAPPSARTDVNLDAVRREARRIVERGLGSGRIQSDGASGLQMRALGRHRGVLGVLITEDNGTSDHAERTLLGLVEALATVQLEHRSGLDEAEAALRSSIMRLMLAGESELAQRVSESVITRLPAAPLAVIRYDASFRLNAQFADDLHSFDAGSPGLISADDDSGPLIFAEARHLSALRRIFLQHGVPAGISERGELEDLESLRSQANRALAVSMAVDPPSPVIYHPALHGGVLQLLEHRPEARQRAESFLAPLRHHDARHADSIQRSVAVWLRHHGQTSPAAAELGVHRHTLRSRIQTAASLLERDIDSPDTRAELWAALRLTGLAGLTNESAQTP